MYVGIFHNCAIGDSVVILQSESGSNSLFLELYRNQTIALRINATPKEAIIITWGEAFFFRKSLYTNLSIINPTNPVTIKAATKVYAKTDQTKTPSGGETVNGKK